MNRSVSSQGGATAAMMFVTPAAECALLDGNNLFSACKNKNVPKVVGLLKRGDDPDEINDLGWAPIHMAARVGSDEIVRHLVAAGANVYLANSFGKNCLHLAAENDHYSLVMFLGQTFPDMVNRQDVDGMTPLMRAALAGKKQTVQLLCSNFQANADLSDLWGRTAVDLALAKQYKDIAGIIEEKLSLRALENGRVLEDQKAATVQAHLTQLRAIREANEKRKRDERASQKDMMAAAQ